MAQNLVQPAPSTWTFIQPFVVGGLSGSFASAVLYPIDLTKVRIQIRSEELGKAGHKGEHISPFTMAREVYKTDGIRGFYKGVDSSIVRQLLFSTTRMGVYKTMFDAMKEADGTVSPLKKFYAAFVAGFLGSVIGNPADVSMIRMQADPTLPPAERRNYKHVFDAFSRIVKEEGTIALWKGSLPTLVRGIVVNLGMLAPYDEIRERMNKWTGTVDTMSTKIAASGGAGFLASFFCLPFDNVKTKLQKMKPDHAGVLPYSGITDCFVKSIQREGFTRLWVGFFSFYSRTAPHVMITLLIQDFIANWSRRNGFH